LLTEWKEFRLIDFEKLKKQMKQAIIFDGRNQYRTFELEKNEFEYFQIGKL
jgi:UDPglucose 6-dehydrogenase